MEAVASEPVRVRPRIVSLTEARAMRAVSGSGTIAEAWEIYRAHVTTARRAKKTLEGYASAVKHALSDLSPKPSVADVEHWLDYILVKRKGLSPSTANFVLRVLRSVTQTAARITHDHTLADIFAEAEPLQEQEKHPRCPPHDALWKAVGALSDTCEKSFVLLLATTGMRIGEALAIEPGDFNPERSLLHVCKQKGGRPRKNKKALWIELGPMTATALRYVIANRDKARSRQGWFRGENRAIFPWGKTRIERIMSDIRRELGEDADVYFPRGLAFHAFRHFKASDLANNGASVSEIQAALGDASPTVAMMYNPIVRSSPVTSAKATEQRMWTAGQQLDIEGTKTLLEKVAEQGGRLNIEERVKRAEREAKERKKIMKEQRKNKQRKQEKIEAEFSFRGANTASIESNTVLGVRVSPNPLEGLRK